MDNLKKPLRPFAIVPTALVCDPTMKLTAIKVYAVLASHKQADNTAWCSLDRAVEALGIDKPAICKGLRQLQQGGYIAKIKVGGGHRNTSKYLIAPPANPPVAVVSGDNGQIDIEEAIEAKNFAESIVSGDNKTVSQETPKYTGGETTPPYPPFKGGDTVGPNGPSQEFVGAPDGAINDAPDGSSQSPRPGNETEAEKPGSKINCPKRSPGGAKSENCANPETGEAVSRSYARQKLVEYFGNNNGAYSILLAADDPENEDHDQAAAACLAAAAKLKIHWSPPKRSLA